jgi:hypothetical protein
MIALVDLGTKSELPITAMFRMNEMIEALVKAGMLPNGQAQAVNEWLRTLN